MSAEPVEKWFGRTLSQWMQDRVNELDLDAVGLWQVIPSLKEDFGLSGITLEDAAVKTIIMLLEKGAVPVDGISWKPIKDLGSDAFAMASKIVSQSKHADWNVDFASVWFVLPGGVKYADKPASE